MSPSPLPACPILHAVAGDEHAGRPGFVHTALRLLETFGPDLALHLRLKQASGRELFELACRLSTAARRTDSWCVVNERLDVALTARAQAVQLGHTALPLPVAMAVIDAASTKRPTHGGVGRAHKPISLAIGASVHSEPEARRAVAEGANYLVLGTIFSSRTHPGVRPHGSAIVQLCRDIGRPLIAIGGIDGSHVPELKRAGADGIAVVRAVWNVEDPFEAAGTLIEAWKAS